MKHRKTHNRRNRRRGFTLVEVTLVLVILSIIGGIAVVSIQSAQKQNYIRAAGAKITAYENELERYQLDVLEYPSSDEGLNALYECPSDVEETIWGGRYIDDPPEKDPWHQEYNYEYPGTHNTDGYDLYSSGPDKMAGNEDDIGNWTNE
jgi:general secretion pathway protein G